MIGNKYHLISEKMFHFLMNFGMRGIEHAFPLVSLRDEVHMTGYPKDTYGGKVSDF